MTTHYMRKLSTRLFSPLVIIVILVFIVLLTYVPSVTKEHTINAAINSAQSTVQQYKTIRSYYTKNIIKKVLGSGVISPDYNHKDDAKKIPLPATFIHDLSKELTQKNIVSLKLYSPFPFPNRASSKLDKFGQSAWNKLNSNPTQIYSQVETIAGKQVVRVAIADTMVAQGCVNCHNSHPETPKNDWQLNDVRGVLEVQVPIEEQLNSANNLNFTISAIVVVALSLTIGWLFFMFRNLVSNRLRSVTAALNDIAQGEGDLSQRLIEEPRDEIGAIATAFNDFMKQLSVTLKQINEQLEQLTNSTSTMEEITKTTQDGAREQQNITEHVVSSMADMTASTNEMTLIASHTSDNSQNTLEQSETGRKIVEENLASVRELSTMMNNATEAVSNLETDSQNIGGVLDVIRGIADQTNLLALNAAIEAARAGEQGRGFAVVADEVRTLASRTQESTAEINRMIEQLQSGAKNAVETIQLGSSSIEISQDKANQTNEMIENIGESIAEIQSQNMQLSTAADSQANISQEINHNINNIKDVSQHTSESSDQLLALAEQINQSVKTINDQLRRFIH